ncbi:MAG: response regulator [Phycisphaerales bacterium]
MNELQRERVDGEDPWVLSVEDDAGDRRLIERAVRSSSAPCRIEFAENSSTALERLENAVAAGAPPNVVLLDLNLPGLGGRALLSHVRDSDRLRQLVIVILTTSRNPEDVRWCYDNACNGFLRKPNSWSELSRIMDRTLEFWVLTAERPTLS